jgi:hypothetical protein
VNARWLVLYLLALATPACGGAADIPETPDLRELLQNYQRPTAALDGSNVDAVLNRAPNLKELAAGFDAAKYIPSEVDYASNSTSPKTGSRLRLQGSLKLDVRCPGERLDPVYDEQVNGSVSLTIAVANNRILRSMGGDARACVLQSSIQGVLVRTVIDGPIAFDLGNDIGIGQYWSGELLASLPGELRVGDYVFESVSARFTQGRFQHLVRLEDGSTVVLELSREGVTIRDGAGVWVCAEGLSCAKP